jgi:hypothetical protein
VADAELLSKLLGQTAFAKGVLDVLLATLPKNSGVKLRALLLNESVRAAENPDGDGGSLSLQLGNRLEDADTHALLTTLQSEHRKLTNLNLGGNWLGSQFGLAIAAALQSEHCKLTNLDLGFNELGAEAGLAIVAALQSERCKLTNLEL